VSKLRGDCSFIEVVMVVMVVMVAIVVFAINELSDLIDGIVLIVVCLRWASTTRHQRIFIYSRSRGRDASNRPTPYQ
jgi:hypothetical protein